MSHTLFMESFQALTRSSRVAHFLLSLDGMVVAVNAAAAEFLHSDESRLINTSLSSLVAEPQEVVRGLLQKCARTSGPIPLKLTWLPKDKEPLSLPCQGYRLRLPSLPDEEFLLLKTNRPECASDTFLALNRMLAELRTSKHKLLAKSTLLEEEIVAHQKSAAALKISTERLTKILDSLEALVYVADMQTYELLFINRYGREAFGEMTGHLCWQSLQKGQSGPCEFCTNKHLLTDDGSPGEPYCWEFQNTQNGRWYYIIDRAIPWDDGRLVRFEIAADITERKEAEIRLRLDEERVESLLQLSQREWRCRDDLADYALEEAVRLTGSTVGYLHFMDEKEQTIELFSWSKAVYEQCSASKLVHYPLAEAGIWADSVRLRKPVIHNDYQSEPARQGYPEGHFHVVRHMSVPVFDQEKIVAVAGVGNKEHDYDDADASQLSLFMKSMWGILKQKQTELEVRRAKEEWESTFDAIDDVVTIHDTEMRILRANKAAGALFDVDPHELIGKHCYALFQGISQPCDGCPEVLAFQHQQTFRADILHENLGKIFEVTSSPIFNGDSTLIGSIHTAKDITAKKKLEEQLNQAQKMEAIGTLAGGIAHDFNNILAPILGFTDMALEKSEPATSLASDLEQVRKAANRAKELVKQILSFSRQAGHKKQPLQPHLVIKEALKLLRASLPTTIEIRQNIPTDCGTILMDPTQLHQVIMNLSTNAYHAMRETGGILAVTLSQVSIDQSDSKVIGKELAAGNYIRLEVSDTGHGMPQAILDKVFEPYFTTKAKGEGTGLGLAVVHGIIKSHNGHITAYSEVGRGTTFNLYLPRIEKKGLETEEIRQTPLPKGSERILVVDDEEPIINMIRFMLKSLGYRVRAFTDCEEALLAFRTHPEEFDLVITDMTMPRITGLQLTGELLAVRPDIPVVLCTGFSELINEEKAKAAGIRKYIMKPLSKRDLAMVVREVLDE